MTQILVIPVLMQVGILIGLFLGFALAITLVAFQEWAEAKQKRRKQAILMAIKNKEDKELLQKLWELD